VEVPFEGRNQFCLKKVTKDNIKENPIGKKWRMENIKKNEKGHQ